ncbi:peptide ABC transporter substrate-binding protein [Vineibacter terrae]|uniref:peptide ABC transporter substrate-binding protein n=1 Tax=Vineibacter terrae TaxID=2586908 RepID=UPI002E2F725A|nr:peptide ABC transporter substrate-binding protein [Vineibacter terrae]HEX2887074.1 peptide ABC transporter substrate-binding protein [Vineibacter terrae]
MTIILRLAVLLLACAVALVRPAAAKDELVIGMTQYPSSFNPNIGSMLAKSLVEGMTLRPVTAWDPDWKLVCLLCTELPTIENGGAVIEEYAPGKKGIAVTYTLRPDLKWGDGTPVSTRDVAFTLEVGKHPQSGVAAAEGYRRILKLDIKDDRTFTFHTDRVTFDYNALGDFRLLPAHVERPVFEANPAEYRNRSKFETDTTNTGLWFGPYRIVKTVPGASVELERNPAWSGKAPYFRRIVFRIIENTAALEANLLSGSIDYVIGELGLSLDQALSFEKRHKDRFDVVYKPGLVYEHIDINLDNPLLADRRIRHALMLGIDREAISARLFEGKQPVAHSSVNPLDPMYSPGARHYAYDAAAARKLLDEAGFSEIRGGVRQNAKGERLSIELATTAGNRNRELIQQVLQSQWKQIGIDVRLKVEPPRVFFGDTVNKRAYSGLAMYAWVSAPQSVPRTTLHSQEIPSQANNWSGQNSGGYKNPEMDRLLDAMEVELDVARRKALFGEMQRIYTEDLPVLPLYFRSDVFVLPKALKGVRPTGHLNVSTLWVEDWRWADPNEK